MDDLTFSAYSSLLGWPTFPVTARGKHPTVPGGFKAATTDQVQHAEWEKRFPGHNIGMPTGKPSGIFALDIDGDEGLNSLGALFDLNGALPATCIVATGGGGLHYLFRWVEGVGNRTALWPGCDVRGDGGYIVVPPSVHPSGKRYEFTRPPGTGIADAPSWLIEAIRKPVFVPGPYVPATAGHGAGYGAGALRAEVKILLEAREGQRNHQLNISALKLGSLVAGGYLQSDDVVAELRQAALYIGLGEVETERTIRSGLTAGMRAPRGPKPQVAQYA